MLTICSAAHIATNRHRRSFRAAPASTGPRLLCDVALLAEWAALCRRERRRRWLEQRWRAHLRAVGQVPELPRPRRRA